MQGSFARGKILVVDDDPDQLEVVCLNLVQAGFSIGTATNGLDALKKAESGPPDLIVLDVVMPQVNGFVVCETLRKNPATASVPILMLTGLHSHISRLTGLEAGATDYLLKPFDPGRLVAKVEELCPPAVSSKKPDEPTAKPVAVTSPEQFLRRWWH